MQALLSYLILIEGSPLLNMLSSITQTQWNGLIYTNN